ncbi:Pentatricopeptide repeat-containing protein [Acorus gramineus]|uniref:Pentatricopeptide repeat-containing protein n=1 Tax=Acorus gramineus TaxID=55184 RepID=A0AAV9BHL3_ACOGR|nr:Pentatricopeptide repeat-containing protein [Acorus gramineus]
MPFTQSTVATPPTLLDPHQRRTTSEIQQLHAQSIKQGLFYNDPSIAINLIKSFSSSTPTSRPSPTHLDYILSIFNQTPISNSTSTFIYNTLITSYAQTHLPEKSFFLFHQMLHDPNRLLPDNFTFTSVLTSCARSSALEEGEQTHSLVYKTQSARDDVFVNNSLIHMYSRCGHIEKARLLFDRMPHRNVVSWNSLIDGCVKNSMPEEAIELFLRMRDPGRTNPDESTLVSVVSAVSELGLLCFGKTVHGHVVRNGFDPSGVLGGALINMYTKCGCIAYAFRVFHGVQCKGVEHWTSMIVGFATYGRAEDSLRLFNEMQSLGIKPNYVTYVGVLNACSHGGLVEEGVKIFCLMRMHGVRPGIHHYGCLVDLLGRSGLLKEALVLIENMPIEPGVVIWATLLSACSSHGNVEIAKIAARRLKRIDPSYGGCYVLLSQIYARLGRWEEVSGLRREMEGNGVKKDLGYSCIEVNGEVHEFVAGDEFHWRSIDVYRMLDEMEHNLRWVGCTFADGDVLDL